MNIDLSQCRICLYSYSDSPDQLKSIFEKETESESVADVLMKISNMQTLEYTYLLPTKICERCWRNVSIARKVREQCLNSDRYFKQLLLGKPIKLEAIQGLVNFNEDEAESVKLESENPEIAVFEGNENEIVEIEETEYLVEHGEVSEDCFESQEDHEMEAELYTVEEIIDEDFSDQQQQPEEQSFIICESQISNPVQVSPPKKVYRKQTDAPGQCAVCGKSYKNLRAHLKTHQEKPEMKFECDKCGEFFRYKSYIYRHMNYIHINAKKHKCSICGKGFSRTDNLKNHMYSHLEDKPYPCTYCQKSFVTRQMLLSHTRSHTGERPYKCTVCPRTYIHYTDLKRHTMTHTGERPYKCVACDRGFIKRSSLLIHEKTHRKGVVVLD